jgi:hypothetical protein
MILWMVKLELRDSKLLAQGHTEVELALKPNQCVSGKHVLNQYSVVLIPHAALEL